HSPPPPGILTTRSSSRSVHTGSTPLLSSPSAPAPGHWAVPLLHTRRAIGGFLPTRSRAAPSTASASLAARWLPCAPAPLPAALPPGSPLSSPAPAVLPPPAAATPPAPLRQRTGSSLPKAHRSPPALAPPPSLRAGSSTPPG